MVFWSSFKMWIDFGLLHYYDFRLGIDVNYLDDYHFVSGTAKNFLYLFKKFQRYSLLFPNWLLQVKDSSQTNSLFWIYISLLQTSDGHSLCSVLNLITKRMKGYWVVIFYSSACWEASFVLLSRDFRLTTWSQSEWQQFCECPNFFQIAREPYVKTCTFRSF